MYFITKLHFPIFPRHLQRFWGASGDFWQALWDRLLDVTGEDPFTFWVYGKDYFVEWCNALFEDRLSHISRQAWNCLSMNVLHGSADMDANIKLYLIYLVPAGHFAAVHVVAVCIFKLMQLAVWRSVFRLSVLISYPEKPPLAETMMLRKMEQLSSLLTFYFVCVCSTC